MSPCCLIWQLAFFSASLLWMHLALGSWRRFLFACIISCIASVSSQSFNASCVIHNVRTLHGWTKVQMQPWRVLSYILFVLILIFHLGKLDSSVQRRIADRYRPKQSDRESRFDKGPLRLHLLEDVSLQPSRSAAVILLHCNILWRRSRCIGDFFAGLYWASSRTTVCQCACLKFLSEVWHANVMLWLSVCVYCGELQESFFSLPPFFVTGNQQGQTEKKRKKRNDGRESRKQSSGRIEIFYFFSHKI